MIDYVIYLPGFGDSKNAAIQIKLINKWQKFGLRPEFQKINWSNNEPYDLKLKRILKRVDNLLASGHRVSLVGVSAGATMAINIYSARKQNIERVVFICGKINHPEKVGEFYFRRNPAFKESLSTATKNLQKLTNKDKAKMLSIHPIFDETVYVRDTILRGATNKTIFSFFHAPSIVLALSIYRKKTINFIKE